MSSVEWGRRACGKWTATEVARHVLAVARWYHHWLDRAEAGETERPFVAAELAERNDAEIGRLADLSGREAVQRFEGVALDYLERLDGRWELPYPFPYGVIRAGQHAGLAAAEWHLHTWDLTDGSHRPASPEALYLAVGAAFAAARGGLPGSALGRMVPIGARRKPWETLLRQSGRRRS